MKRAKNAGRAVGRGLLRALLWSMPFLPMPVALRIGASLGTLIRLAARKRRAIALKNLRIAFGDTISEGERKRIAWESFRQFGMFAIENIKCAVMTNKDVAPYLRYTQDSVDMLHNLLSRGKGVLFLTGHIGNFEMAARFVAIQGLEILVVARAARDEGTTNLWNRVRTQNGMQVIQTGRTLKPILAGLARNACVAIVCDQNSTDIVVPFFGRPTGTAAGPAKIALKTGTPIVVGYCVRDGKGGYVLDSAGIIEPESTGDDRADVERVMTQVNKHFETIIRAYPEQWLWIHDRFKYPPEGEPTP